METERLGTQRTRTSKCLANNFKENTSKPYNRKLARRSKFGFVGSSLKEGGGGWGVPIPMREHTLWSSLYILVCTVLRRRIGVNQPGSGQVSYFFVRTKLFQNAVRYCKKKWPIHEFSGGASDEVINANKIFEFTAGEKKENRIKEIAPPITVPCVSYFSFNSCIAYIHLQY